MANLEEKLTANPATTQWLKEQIVNTKAYQPQDMINEAEALLFLLKQRMLASSVNLQ